MLKRFIKKVFEWVTQVVISAKDLYLIVDGILSWKSYATVIGTWPRWAEQPLNTFQIMRNFGITVENKAHYDVNGDYIISFSYLNSSEDDDANNYN